MHPGYLKILEIHRDLYVHVWLFVINHLYAFEYAQQKALFARKYLFREKSAKVLLKYQHVEIFYV